MFQHLLALMHTWAILEQLLNSIPKQPTMSRINNNPNFSVILLTLPSAEVLSLRT